MSSALSPHLRVEIIVGVKNWGMIVVEVRLFVCN